MDVRLVERPAAPPSRLEPAEFVIRTEVVVANTSSVAAIASRAFALTRATAVARIADRANRIRDADVAATGTGLPHAPGADAAGTDGIEHLQLVCGAGGDAAITVARALWGRRYGRRARLGCGRGATRGSCRGHGRRGRWRARWRGCRCTGRRRGRGTRGRACRCGGRCRGWR